MVIVVAATPVSFIYGSYEWAVNDTEPKLALMLCIKLWVAMIFGGLIIGLPSIQKGLNFSDHVDEIK